MPIQIEMTLKIGCCSVTVCLFVAGRPGFDKKSGVTPDSARGVEEWHDSSHPNVAKMTGSQPPPPKKTTCGDTNELGVAGSKKFGLPEKITFLARPLPGGGPSWKGADQVIPDQGNSRSPTILCTKL